MRKPTVRKVAGSWRVVRPGYGFSPGTVTEFSSWKAALKALESCPGSASAQVTMGEYTLGVRNRRRPARPRWIDAADRPEAP